MVAERKPRPIPVHTITKTGVKTVIHKLAKDCPVCGCPMHIRRKEKGGVFKARKVFWACTNMLSCKHEEREETESEETTRRGGHDEELNILPDPSEDQETEI